MSVLAATGECGPTGDGLPMKRVTTAAVARVATATRPGAQVGEGVARIRHPIAYEHINFLGRYAFTRADADAGLRPFHDPTQEADTSDTPTAAPTP
ncbi:hypothetical protein [Actinomadura litoris]|uniref:hypothetical protein n=1 Tax=Actinomadura litoris TaxID=2678616 RepID=UPI001FA6B078|nr:hypothetical protein [Actinomadura litoris]